MVVSVRSVIMHGVYKYKLCIFVTLSLKFQKTDTLSDAELENMAKRVLTETVGVSSRAARITFQEFEQVLSRSFDFSNLFRFSV